MADSGELGVEGSWGPTISFLLLTLVIWLSWGSGQYPVRFRRWYNLKVSRHQKRFSP